MTILLITAAAEEPVDLTLFRQHARIDGDDDAQDVGLKLLAARVQVENDLDRPLITSTWELRFAGWPCEYFELLGNTQSIVAVEWTDAAGVPHTVDPSIYRLVRAYDPASGPSDMRSGRLYCAPGCSWPSGQLDVGEPIAVRVVAGWKDAAAVPAPIAAWIELLAAHWYRNREAALAGNSPSAAATAALALPPDVGVYAIRSW